MNVSNSKEKIEAALILLREDSTSLEKIESLSKLLRGINSKIDDYLKASAKAISMLGKLERGELVELSIDSLPEENEEQKKRKKALLLLIKTCRELTNEVERVKGEMDANGGIDSFGKVAAFAKGPFGFTTLIAIIIIAFYSLFLSNEGSLEKPANNVQSMSKIAVIKYMDKYIPISELEKRKGSDCRDSSGEVLHYHAANGRNVAASDGSRINDPGSCAFGKINEVAIEEISL